MHPRLHLMSLMLNTLRAKCRETVKII